MFSNRRKVINAEDEFRAILYSIGDGVITTDTLGKITRMNPVAELLTGWKESEASGKNLREVFNIIDDISGSQIENPVEKVLQNGSVIEQKNHSILVTKNNRKIPVADSGAPIKNSVGDIVGVVLVFRDETEARKKKKILKESEAKFSTMFQSSPVGITISRSDGTLLDVNDIFLKTSGYTRSEIIGLMRATSNFWYNLEDRQKFLNELFQNGRVLRMEAKFCMKSGEIKTCFISAEIIELDNEKLILSTILDITDHKKAEDELKTSRAQLSTALEIAHLGHWEYDFVKDVFTFNDQFYKMFHTTAEREGGYTMSSAQYAERFVHPEDIPLVGIEIKKSVETDNPEFYSKLEHRIVYADGGTGTISVRFFIIKDSDGRTIKSFGVNQDISERIKTEEAIRTSEKKFSTAFHTSPDSVNINRMSDGLYVEVNEGFRKMTGYKPEEVIGKTSIELNIWDDPQDRDYLVRQLKDSGEVNNFEAQFRKKDGSVLTGLMSARIISLSNVDCILTITRDITERKRAEEALRESQDKYQSVVSNVKEVIFQTDVEGRWTFLNSAWEEITGFKSEESKGLVCVNFVYPEDRERGHELFKSLINKEKEFCRNEIRYLNKDGGFSWVEVYATLQVDNSGNAIGTTGTLMNITERKKAEEEIRKLSRGIEQSPSTIVITDLAGNIEYINPSFTRVTGYSSEEVIGQNTRILKSGDKSPEDYKNLWTTITNKQEWRGKFQNKKKNGELYWESASISPILNDNGEITNFIAVKEDITEQMQMEEALTKERLVLRTVIDNLPDAIFVKDTQGRKTLANIADLSIMGAKSESEVIGKTDFEYYEKEVAEKFFADDEDIFRNGTPIINREMSLTDKDGKTKWLLTSKLPLRESKKGVVGLVGISRDITQRKLDELELIKAKEKAEEMNKIKSYFYANVSHELRTPFVGIIGYSELLADSLQDPEEKEMAEVILKSSKRLTDTLNKILNIAKLEFEKPQLRLTEINLIDFIKGVQKLFSKSAGLQKTTITSHFKTEPIIIKSDEMFLDEILTNLVSNAVKYCQNGSIEIILEVVNKNGSQSLIIKISDTGIGIPKEKQDVIWQEFRQVSEGFNRSFEGTGLGLSLVKKYVELLGGVISLESETGKGSTFTIELPYNSAEEKLQTVNTLRTADIDNELKEKPAQLERILFVEDEPVTTDFVKRILSGNYLVDAVGSAEEALQKIKMYQYPLLLLDINLGYGMDGIELLQKIREQKDYKNIPAVAITAFASTSDKDEFLSKGFTHYISKPFAAKDLRSLMKKILA